MQPTSPLPSSTQPETAPLDEAEITRLIAAARTESYRPSQMVPQGKTVAFRPKSLLELAKHRRDAEKAASMPDVPPEQGASVADQTPVPPSADAGVTQPVTPFDATDELAAQYGPSLHDPTDDQANGNGDLGADGAAAVPDIDAASAPALALAASSGTAAVPGDPAELERIRAEAFAAGRAEAEADLRDGLIAATQALEAAAQAFLNPVAEGLAELRADITDAVLRLASERAGVEIDTMPYAFLDRIEALADRIHAQASQPVLRLHPDDLAAIEGMIASSDSLASMRIVASVELSRGDVDLSVDGLRLSDRILGQPASRKTARAARKPKADGQ